MTFTIYHECAWCEHQWSSTHHRPETTCPRCFCCNLEEPHRPGSCGAERKETCADVSRCFLCDKWEDYPAKADSCRCTDEELTAARQAKLPDRGKEFAPSIASKVQFRALLLLLAYVLVAWTVYRFRHPEQSETEMLLNFLPAMLWR